MFSQILDHSLPKSLKGVIKCYSAESAAALLLQGTGVWTGCNYWLQVFSVVRDLLAIINWWQQFRWWYKRHMSQKDIAGSKSWRITASEQWAYLGKLQTYPKFSQRYNHLLQIWLQRRHVLLPLNECCICIAFTLRLHLSSGKDTSWANEQIVAQ